MNKCSAFKAVASALVGIASLTASTAIVSAGTPKDTLVVAAHIGDIRTLDPAESFEISSSDLINNVYDKLVGFDPHDLAGGIVPGLAESWEFSEDGRTITFKIRDGVTFSSGNPVTAFDAEYSLRRAVYLNKTPSFILRQFGFNEENAGERIVAVDGRTLKITTDRKYAGTFVLNCLTATVGAVVDSELVKQNEVDGDWGNNWLKTNSAGSGAYSLRNWRANESYSLKANEEYWRVAPEISNVFVQHTPESATQRLLLAQGDVDVARNLTPADIEAIEENADLSVSTDLRGRLMYLGLNQNIEPLNNPKVVEAIKYLVDYSKITESVLRGQFTPHQAFLPKTYLGAIDDSPYSFDIEKAKALLSEAGYEDGFETEILVRNAQDRMQVAQVLQNTLAQAGIKAEVEVSASQQELAKYRSRGHEIYLGVWGPDYPDPNTNAGTFALNPDNSDDADFKTLAWRNAWEVPASISKKVLAAAEENDPEARTELYQEAQRDFQETAPFAIMFQQTEKTGIRAEVKGLVTGSAVSYVYYWTVSK
ncbi:ABC transporter substrate-binding protein [Nitratireductor aquibiodomus]|uniref:ABC transporter substrate-binding protein n=1 Tax=Nitratireductor aquibiodomus TaxID=204799 RepID=UPI00058D8594|nr:ABC transporter substrate-binding protein [Nitratireductor aquibiodomus]